MPSIKLLAERRKRLAVTTLVILLVLGGVGYGGFYLYKNDVLGPLSPKKQSNEKESSVPLQAGEATELLNGPQQIKDFKPTGTIQIQVVPEGPDTPPAPKKSKPAASG